MSLVVRIRNVSDLADVSDYVYDVLVGGDTHHKVLAVGEVIGHRRSDGWKALVQRVLDEAKGV